MTSRAPIADTHTLIYAHTTSSTVLMCDVSLGSLSLPTPAVADYVEEATKRKKYYTQHT
jgi:hypothetical protein